PAPDPMPDQFALPSHSPLRPFQGGGRVREGNRGNEGAGLPPFAASVSFQRRCTTCVRKTFRGGSRATQNAHYENAHRAKRNLPLEDGDLNSADRWKI